VAAEPIPLFQVDAFTEEPFHGNPAAVCLLEAPADAAWMQAVAAEMNLSETAFVVPQGDTFGLRWFTPAVEVPLCGHATLASAHVLFEEDRLPRDRTAVFETASGLLRADAVGDRIALDFPAFAPTETEPNAAAVAALGVQPRAAAVVEREGSGGTTLVLELDSEAAVRATAPDFAALAATGLHAAVVTARGDGEPFDFVSRFFAPAAGIDEDPVTGFAHCCLGPYWRKRLSRDAFTAHQASPRGGTVFVEVHGDRVRLLGHAVTVLRGTLAA
jgi:PhzF family phenazine biosynthesis protein